MSRIVVTRVGLPPAGVHGWGSALIPLPGGREIALSLPHGRAAFRLATVDVSSRTFRVDGAVGGEIRDALFDDDGNGWVLTTQALRPAAFADGRLKLAPATRPRGLGTHQHRLFALGRRHLGVCGWASKSLAVLARESGELVKRLPMVAPSTALARGDQTLLLAPHGAEAIAVDLESLSIRGRWPMPFGTHPLAVDGHVFMLAGERQQSHPGVALERQWRITRDRVLRLDPASFVILAQAPAPPQSRDVLGVDDAGRLVLSTEHGLALVDRDLREVDRVDLPSRRPLLAHAWLPGLNTLVAHSSAPQPGSAGELVTFSW